MILITGGAFQGKGACAIKLTGKDAGEITVADGRIHDHQEALGADVWDHMTQWVRRRMEAGEDVDQAVEQVLKENPSIIIVTQELGCGLVPMDSFDRRYREDHGRLCCRLAKQAEAVYRVSCGIAVKIKGEETC